MIRGKSAPRVGIRETPDYILAESFSMRAIVWQVARLSELEPECKSSIMPQAKCRVPLCSNCNLSLTLRFTSLSGIGRVDAIAEESSRRSKGRTYANKNFL